MFPLMSKVCYSVRVFWENVNKIIGRYFIDCYENDSFKKLNWRHDVSDAGISGQEDQGRQGIYGGDSDAELFEAE